MHEGCIEPAHTGERWVDMDGVAVARQPVDRRLLGQRRQRDFQVVRSVGHRMQRQLAIGRTAEAAIAEVNASGKAANGWNFVSVRGDSTCTPTAGSLFLVRVAGMSWPFDFMNALVLCMGVSRPTISALAQRAMARAPVGT